MDRFHELGALFCRCRIRRLFGCGVGTGEFTACRSVRRRRWKNAFGVTLFNRSTRSLTLTDQGQRYYERTKPLVDEMDDADGELTSSTQNVSGLIRIAASSTFGRLRAAASPDLLSIHPGLREVDLVLSDFFFSRHGGRSDRSGNPGGARRRIRGGCPAGGEHSPRMRRTRRHSRNADTEESAELIDHNCLLYGGLTELAKWLLRRSRRTIQRARSRKPFVQQSNNPDCRLGRCWNWPIRQGFADELSHPDIITIFDEFVRDVRDISLVWPTRRLIPARVRRVTDFAVAHLSVFRKTRVSFGAGSRRWSHDNAGTSL